MSGMRKVLCRIQASLGGVLTDLSGPQFVVLTCPWRPQEVLWNSAASKKPTLDTSPGQNVFEFSHARGSLIIPWGSSFRVAFQSSKIAALAPSLAALT